MKRSRTSEKDEKASSVKTPDAKKSGSDVIDSIFSSKRKKEKEPIVNKPKKIKRVPEAKQQSNQSVLEAAFSKPGGNEWVDDGLGGRFNPEGFTGRVEDGVKIFKAHVLNRPKAGSTKDCPFDCDCCFI